MNRRKFQHQLKKILIFTILFFYNQSPTQANVALPGFFNTGGGGSFNPVNKEDYKKAEQIQMKNELITIILFNGFAVVKGEYDMYNSSDKSLTFITSFPKNGKFNNNINVSFNELDNITVFSAQNSMNIKEKENWYEWENTFKAKSINKIKVYYMLDTSKAFARYGYDSSKDCGLSYILETGQLWKDKIENGRIYIKLMEGLSLDDIYGILPEKFISDNSEQLIYDFKDLEPDYNNNVVIRYRRNFKDFDFKQISKNYKKYFSDLDMLEANKIDTANFHIISKTNFSPPRYTDLFILAIILFLILLIVLPIVLIIRFFIKRFKKRRKTK